MIQRDDLPPTPDWSPEPHEAPSFVAVEMKMPLLWTGDQN
jgi:hypothetical protein